MSIKRTSPSKGEDILTLYSEISKNNTRRTTITITDRVSLPIIGPFGSLSLRTKMLFAILAFLRLMGKAVRLDVEKNVRLLSKG